MSMPTAQSETASSAINEVTASAPVLNLQGALTVSDAERLYHMLSGAIQDNGFVSIDISEVSHIDLAVMQILVSSVRDGIAELRSSGKSLNTDLVRQFQLAGQAHLLLDA